VTIRPTEQTDSEFLYLDEQHNILKGAAAERLLKDRNDAAFLSESSGIVRVSLDRWSTAQEFEKKYWLEICQNDTQDRNDEHFDNFNGYQALNGKVFSHAIELGCGPFTNLRKIAPYCKISKCSLLDPLIESYTGHPNRTYTRNSLSYENTPLVQKLSHNILLRALRRLIRKTVPSVVHRELPVAQIYNIPIEQMKVTAEYDLVVMINVIEHCYDAAQIFKNIRNCLKPGGIFVFADRYYDHKVVADWVRGKRFDAGHPLLVDRTFIDTELSKYNTLFRQVTQHVWRVEDFDLDHECVYWIGQIP
jgi:SAM-dependent methyltransferase